MPLHTGRVGRYDRTAVLHQVRIGVTINHIGKQNRERKRILPMGVVKGGQGLHSISPMYTNLNGCLNSARLRCLSYSSVICMYLRCYPRRHTASSASRVHSPHVSNACILLHVQISRYSVFSRYTHTSTPPFHLPRYILLFTPQRVCDWQTLADMGWNIGWGMLSRESIM